MAWDISAAWNTGDINSRVTSTCAVIDDAGTPKIIAPVQHGVKCFDRNGNLVWTYNSITNGYDVRHIAVGNLNGTGYNDCSIVCSGYYTTSTDGKVAILDKAGNVLDLLLTSDFSTTSTAPASTVFAAVSGTDIYVSTNRSLHKFTKSGSTWSESWYKEIGACKQITIVDLGNGTRIYVDVTSVGIKCYQTDGTLDWTQGGTNQYQGVFATGKLDSTKTGNQIVLPYQSGGMIIDKDGNNVGSFTPSNVAGGVCVYDCDGDGEDEFYFSDMGRDVYCYERTGANTYSVKYTLSDVLASSTYAGLAHFDINDDGSDEIFIFSTDGYCRIYDKTLSTQLKELNIGHGSAGGFMLSTYQSLQNGIKFADTSEDGFSDLVISGGTGYVDVFEVSGLESGTSTSGERNAKVTGKTTSNSERSAKITGKANTSSERATTTYGSPTLKTDLWEIAFIPSGGGTEVNSERPAKTSGKATANSERAAKAIGQIATSSERTAKTTGKSSASFERLSKIIGKDTSSSERLVKLTGANGSNSERSAKVTGIAPSSSERSAKITGKLTASAERNASALGILTTLSERSAKVTGYDTSTTDRLAKVTGQAATTSDRSAIINGTDSALSERVAKTVGMQTIDSERNAKAVGVDTQLSERLAVTTGKDTVTTERLATIIGQSTVLSERLAQLTGVAIPASSERLAKAIGKDTISSNRSAQVVGKVAADDARAARIAGVATTNSERAAKTRGTSTANSERNVKLIGGIVVSSERAAKMSVIATASDERSAKIRGKLTASSTRGATLTGGVGLYSNNRGNFTQGSKLYSSNPGNYTRKPKLYNNNPNSLYNQKERIVP